MQRVVTARLRITGALADEGFAGWIAERARRLSLEGAVGPQSPERIDVVVKGPQALGDAMELACTLGPAGVLVDRIEIEPLEALPPEVVTASRYCTRFEQMT